MRGVKLATDYTDFINLCNLRMPTAVDGHCGVGD